MNVKLSKGDSGALYGDHKTGFGKMYASDISLTGGQTYGTDSEILSVQGGSVVVWQAYATGAASFSGDITFNIVGSADGSHWTSEAMIDSVVLTGAPEAERSSDMSDTLNVQGISFLKVTSVVNGDGSHTASDVNLIAGVYF